MVANQENIADNKFNVFMRLDSISIIFSQLADTYVK
jgi:hypothetical protein